MKIHLVDGTFELFRAYYGGPSMEGPRGEVGATRTFLRSMFRWLTDGGVTHVAFAFDHVVESFRNHLFEGYKTGEGMDPDLYRQFPLVEEAARALGAVVWPMVEFEADDVLATAAAKYEKLASVDQVVLCSPDKDLAQCVAKKKVVMWDRLRDNTLDEKGVKEKFGVGPASIPDYLALVGDAADGIPGIPRWGAKSASVTLAKCKHLEKIKEDRIPARGAKTLAANLSAQWEDALLYRKLATLRLDVPLSERVTDLRWKGIPKKPFLSFCKKIGESRLTERAAKWLV